MTGFARDITVTITFVDDTTMDIHNFRIENELIVATTLENETKIFQTTQVAKIQRLTVYSNTELEESQEE